MYEHMNTLRPHSCSFMVPWRKWWRLWDWCCLRFRVMTGNEKLWLFSPSESVQATHTVSMFPHSLSHAHTHKQHKTLPCMELCRGTSSIAPCVKSLWSCSHTHSHSHTLTLRHTHTHAGQWLYVWFWPVKAVKQTHSDSVETHCPLVATCNSLSEEGCVLNIHLEWTCPPVLGEGTGTCQSGGQRSAYQFARCSW